MSPELGSRINREQRQIGKTLASDDVSQGLQINAPGSATINQWSQGASNAPGTREGRSSAIWHCRTHFARKTHIWEKVALRRSRKTHVLRDMAHCTCMHDKVFFNRMLRTW